MKSILLLLIVFFGIECYAQNNNGISLSVPMPAQSYQSDRIRSGELDCSNAVGGGTNLELGVTGIVNKQNDPLLPSYGDSIKNAGVYARITIPLDGAKERINCNTLYELEIQRKRLELQKLKEEINQLQQLKFEK